MQDAAAAISCAEVPPTASQQHGSCGWGRMRDAAAALSCTDDGFNLIIIIIIIRGGILPRLRRFLWNAPEPRYNCTGVHLFEDIALLC